MNKKIKEENSTKYQDYSIETDPFGSYTGVPKNKSDFPVQDADDL